MPSIDEQKFSNLINALNQVIARQNSLEERLSQLEKRAEPAAAPTVQFVETPAPAVEPQPAAPPPIVVDQPVTVNEIPIVETPAEDTITAASVPPTEPPSGLETQAAPRPVEQPHLESKVGLMWVNRIGVVTLVLGVAFFFKWAIDNNWIGPSGRVMLGLLAGFLTLAFADYLWRKGQQIYAQGITGAGIAIVYLAFYAAFDFYHLIPQALAFLLLLATTAMAATLALRYNSLAIAVLGFFGAYVIPLLLSNGQDHPWFLISYLFLLNFAATELARRRNWQLLEILSFVATILIFGAWLLERGGQQDDQWAATAGLLALCGQRFRTTLPILFLIGQGLATLGFAHVWHGDYLPKGPSHDSFAGLTLILLSALAGLAFSHLRKYFLIVPTAFATFWLATGMRATQPSSYMLFGTAGFLLFAAWAWWRFTKLDEPLINVAGLSTFALNGIIYYSLAYYVLHENYHAWLGLLAVAVAASYLFFGMAIYKKTGSLDQEAVLLALGISVAFLTLAIPIQLSGYSITIAWAIQAAVLTWIGLRLGKTNALVGALFIFALALFRLASIDSGMYPDVNSYGFLFNTRFFVYVVVAASLLISAYWVSTIERDLAILHFIAGNLVLLCGLCLEVIGWASRISGPESMTSVEAVGVTSMLSLYAAILVGLGVFRHSNVNRVAGLALAGAVVVKLYLYDFWFSDVHSYLSLFNAEFAVLLLLGIAILISISWTARLAPGLDRFTFILAHLILLTGLGMEVINWILRTIKSENLISAETVSITVLLAAYAVILVGIGVAIRSSINRLAGLGLTGIVILKLYLYDVWQLSRLYQIIAFVILGILLLSTSFLYSRFKGLIQDWRQDEKARL